jgi:Uncharacterized membrane protein, required for spore maturation in B.subtilis.
MINKVWIFFIVSGIIYALLTGNIGIINEEILKSSGTAFDLVCKIFPVMALWLGIMKIAENSGLLKKMSNFLSKILKHIFPEIPKGHESFSYIASNVIANLFGLGNAATPFGLKAMKSLSDLNQNKDAPSRSMITFLVLNTSGLTLVPTTIISLRIMHKSSNPTEIILPCILATLCATTVGLIADRILYRMWKK